MSSENQIVKLDIGGTVFKTSKSTLTRFDGMLKVMMETEIPVTKDESGAIFIDRSPKHFDLILNFMRDGDVELPDSEIEIKEIQKEAHFYMLHGLVDKCLEKFIGKPKEIPKLLRTIDSDSELLQIISLVVKPVLVFHCPVNSFGCIDFPLGFNVNEFLEEHENRFKIYFKPFKTDGISMASEWKWTVYTGKYSIESPTKDPRQTFEESLEQHLRDCINGF
uniref:BTB domain-containing protein n=1 Tax=Caenorhabditis tropicalis TaxID=1561998 RepID=A0A1I7TGS6_9PELO